MSASCNIYVCRVVKEFRPEAIVMYIGDEGWARIEDDSCNVHVVMCISRKAGIVPKDYLEIGKQAGNLSIQGMDPLLLQTPLGNSTTGSKLEITLSLLFENHRLNHLVLTNMGCRNFDFTALIDGLNVRDAFIGAMPVRVKNTIKYGEFSFDDLWKLPAVEKTNTQAGVYLILYWKIYGKEDQHAMYCGKSSDLGRRWVSHVACLESKTSELQHYKIGRRAEQCKKILFAAFQKTSPNYDLLQRICEHTSVCLFLSWNRRLLVFPDSIEELQAHLPGMMQAKAFYTLASNVFLQTGWHVGDHFGCNWSTPLCEFNRREYGEYTTWTVQSTPTMRVFTRSPRIVQKESIGREHEVQMLARSPGNPGGVRLHLPFSTGIEARMPLYCVCEIMTDGTDHAIPYCRLPVIGGLTNWGTLRTLGVRVVWEARDGLWKTTWIQCNRFDDTSPPKADGSERVIEAWQRTTLIIDALMRVHYTTPVPAWKGSAQLVIVKEIKYDHWNQAVVISDAQPRYLEAPKPISMEQNELALRARYRGIIIGVIPKDIMANRSSCDMCYIRGYIHGTIKGNDPCRQYPGTTSCARCAVYGRPCTFTPTAELRSKIENQGCWDGQGITGLVSRVDTIGIPPTSRVLIEDEDEDDER